MIKATIDTKVSTCTRKSRLEKRDKLRFEKPIVDCSMLVMLVIYVITENAASVCMQQTAN